MKFALSLREFLTDELNALRQVFNFDALWFNIRHRKRINKIQVGDYYIDGNGFIVRHITHVGNTSDIFPFKYFSFPKVFLLPHKQSPNSNYWHTLLLNEDWQLNQFIKNYKPKFREGDLVWYLGSKWEVDCIKSFYKYEENDIGSMYVCFQLPGGFSFATIDEKSLKLYEPIDVNKFWNKFNEE